MRKFPLSIFIAAAALSLLSGCSALSDKAADDNGPQPYKDPASGVVLPAHVAGLDRTSLDTDDDSGKTPVSAHYSAAQASPASFLHAAIIIEPASKASPDQMLGQTIRALQKNPSFEQEDFQGQRSFGGVAADCAQCSFDRPALSDRATFKVVIVPRGGYLVCFTFLVQATQEKDCQPVMDHFVQAVLSQSTGTVLMTPAD